jgi:hypothetical protein
MQQQATHNSINRIKKLNNIFIYYNKYIVVYIYKIHKYITIITYNIYFTLLYFTLRL